MRHATHTLLATTATLLAGLNSWANAGEHPSLAGDDPLSSNPRPKRGPMLLHHAGGHDRDAFFRPLGSLFLRLGRATRTRHCFLWT